jgi:hypothetical protein
MAKLIPSEALTGLLAERIFIQGKAFEWRWSELPGHSNNAAMGK